MKYSNIKRFFLKDEKTVYTANFIFKRVSYLIPTLLRIRLGHVSSEGFFLVSIYGLHIKHSANHKSCVAYCFAYSK